jgi:hypothetical protein
MSRVIVFDLDNIATGEFRAVVNRGYGLNGSITQQGGMSCTVELPTTALANDWMQFGRMVMVYDEGELLPPWCGMIDAPWIASLPVQATIYSLEYLMQLRTPDSQITVTGEFETVLQQLIDMSNAFSTLNLRMGDLGDLPDGKQELKVMQTPLWGQLNDFAKRSGVEFAFRPTYDQNEPLLIYLDAGRDIGVDTGILLHDGARANIKLADASVNGPIWNRVIAIGKQSTAASQLKTKPIDDDDSISLYDLRSTVIQAGTTVQSVLDKAAQNYLNTMKDPSIKFDILVDDPDIFPACRLGNTFDLHVSEVYLPGGEKGWRGNVRLEQMAYDENQNVITATVMAKL